LNNIGTWFADRNNYDSAYNYLISASKYTLKHGDSRSKVQLIGNLIITTTSLNKFNEAYQYIQLGVPLADELNEYDARISMRLSLANYYIDSKAFKKALKLLYEIRPLIKKERLDHLLTLHTLRNGVFRSLNMHDSAHQAYTDLYYLNEQMIRSNANAQFAELNIKYETIKKEKENLSLKAANKSQQFLIYISILIILVLAVIALLINYKKQLSQKLAESNENKRLIAEERAKNAHISLENEQLKFNATQSELQQMHIIMTAKNNTLFQLKTLLQENANTNPSQLRGDLVRLAAQIEEDIRNENSCTDITNSSIYENFVAKLSKVHPNLSKNDLRLCVYIKLGFSSAEIATFLNITEKSVTVRRSRVRAKLQLEEGTKFKEFLDAI
jgi:DNA-binding CsgD family transcriptional regulator